MTNKQVDYIIVGQGLAGSVLSFLLTKGGHSILVIDKGHDHIASKAAAGLINPITGRYYTKSWLIEELIPVAHQVYSDLEQLLDCKLWYDVNIYRALHKIEQVNDWSLRVHNPNYNLYAGDTHITPYDGIVKKAEGMALIKGGARVDIGLFIDRYRELLAKDSSLLEESLDYDLLLVSKEGVSYKDYFAKGVIFCEGANVGNNPFFNHLPFAPAKGESLHITIGQMKDKGFDVMKHQQYLVPIGDDKYWSGGGFKWKFPDALPTKTFKEEYASSLDGFISTEYSIDDHRAGVRPCVKDRKPMLGTHPNHNNLHLFNGMGTKGTSLAPYFAKQFINYLTMSASLLPEVNLTRFN